jgi:hypothetical protein
MLQGGCKTAAAPHRPAHQRSPHRCLLASDALSAV